MKTLLSILWHGFFYVRSHGFWATSIKVVSFARSRGLRALLHSSSVAARNSPNVLGSPLKQSKKSYYSELEGALKRSPYFLDFEDRTNQVPDYDQKIVCFYLPQFHPFKENNDFWGEGFTEWTNVTKSFPLFEGHYQPRLPKDLGFYDLRLKETLLKQANVARNYGIHGFCFHYYWFSGKHVMETPLKIVAENKDININYALCWANENWTRRWDGRDQDVLLMQQDREEDYLNFIRDVVHYFHDKRYIKINGAPLLIIYRAELLKDKHQAANIWRSYARQAGFPDLHLVMTESFEDKSNLGPFDAVVDFAPNNFRLKETTSDQVFHHPAFQGQIFTYDSVVKYSLEKKKLLPFYHSLCLDWDNSARKNKNATIIQGGTPHLFASWMSQLLSRKPLNELLFVNAWNEWAEGTYLEPDRKNGFAYLQKIYEELNKFDAKRVSYISEVATKFKRNTDYAIIIHLHYFDSFELMKIRWPKVLQDFDVIFTITPNINVAQLKSITSTVVNPLFISVDNRGRDILPFLTVLKAGHLSQYKACLKIHSKKSTHLQNGEDWRNELFEDLLRVSTYTNAIESSTPKTALWTKRKNLKPIETKTSINSKRLASILGRESLDLHFIAGTMFWFRPDLLSKALPESLLALPFEEEPLSTDGSWAHVLERFIGAKIVIDGYKIQALEDTE